MRKKMIAMLLAGGQGSRLYALTKDLAKPAVPFGGKYRIIDFPLSNCVHSGIDTVGILTQYEPFVLSQYIGGGQSWDLNRTGAALLYCRPISAAAKATGIAERRMPFTKTLILYADGTPNTLRCFPATISIK